MTGLERPRVIADNLNKSTYTQANTSRDILDSLEQIKREQAEDHEIAEWVRKNGGVDSIENDLSDYMQIARSVTMALFKDSFQTRIAENDEITEELNRRLMPPGMEWPRFEGGEQVRIGDMVELNTMVAKVCGVFISERGYVLHAESGENTGPDSRFDYPGFARAERPKQDPIGLDGLPIKKGDTVYLLPGVWCGEYPCIGYHGGEELEVFEDGEPKHVKGAVQCRDKEKGALPCGLCYPQPHQLTHTKPDIMGADGKPLKVGDTVWDINGGEHELVITSIELDELEHVKATQEKPVPANVSIHPSRLTHTKPEPPDSWERIERDALNFVEDNAGIPHSQDQMERDIMDLVRRAKELAERDV